MEEIPSSQLKKPEKPRKSISMINNSEWKSLSQLKMDDGGVLKAVAVVACAAMALFYVAILYAPTLILRLPPPPSFKNFMIRRFICAAISSVLSVVVSTLLLPIYLEQALKRNGAESGHRILSKSYGGHLKLKENKGGEHTDETNNVREAHLVVAALIATVTFAAGFTIPGGYQGEKGPEQGFAVLSRIAAFKAFVITNTLALCMSSFSVLMHLYLSMHTKRNVISAACDVVLYITMLALILMVVAFITGTYAVLCHSPGLAITACVIGCFFFLILTRTTLSEISPTYQRLILFILEAYWRMTTRMYMTYLSLLLHPFLRLLLAFTDLKGPRKILDYGHKTLDSLRSRVNKCRGRL